MKPSDTIERFQNYVGHDILLSQWKKIDQEDVDTHARTTGDEMWLHNDVDRAVREGPFGGTIVQGFLLLSLFTSFFAEARFPAVPSVKYYLNYGLDHVRFLRPVLVGSRLRARAKLSQVRDKGDGRAVIGVDTVLEIEGGGSAPALAAEWLFLAVA